jgi:hypothetical protein
MNRYMVVWNGGAWMVKDADFFEQQGGKTAEWGKEWKLIYADSISHARDRAELEFLQGIRKK